MRAKLRPLALFLIILFLGALAAGNFYVLRLAPFGVCTIGEIATNLEAIVAAPDTLFIFPATCLTYVYYFVGAPLVVGLLLLLSMPNLVTSREVVQEEPPPPPTPEPRRATPPPKPTTDAAIQLLGLLQREGRLVDFLREDIQPYNDEQIGAAVRAIHQGCRQILSDHLTLEPILEGAEGDEITIESDFEPSAIRLTGNVSGEPPFRGTLRHAGWRVKQIKLPAQPAGQDPKVVAPAEVEIE
ncbi:MAG: DUF2760 domain-containing protein [Candidatus Binatia bacterium]